MEPDSSRVAPILAFLASNSGRTSRFDDGEYDAAFDESSRDNPS
jgi:hypothetical protein